MDKAELTDTEKLIQKLDALADITEIKDERLNATSRRCIDIARVCIIAASQMRFQVVGRGKLPTIDCLKEARAWIKQALDADQKNIDQEANEALDRLAQQEAASGIAATLQ